MQSFSIVGGTVFYYHCYGGISELTGVPFGYACFHVDAFIFFYTSPVLNLSAMMKSWTDFIDRRCNNFAVTKFSHRGRKLRLFRKCLASRQSFVAVNF